jgi:hypothetical protein
VPVAFSLGENVFELRRHEDAKNEQGRNGSQDLETS